MLIESVTIGESIVGAIFFLVSALLVSWLAFIATLQIELGDELIVRRSLFGEVRIRAEDLTETRWSHRRGQKILTIRTRNSWIMLPDVSFERSDLSVIERSVSEMRAHVAAKAST